MTGAGGAQFRKKLKFSRDEKQGFFYWDFGVRVFV